MATEEPGTKHTGTEHRQSKTKEYQIKSPFIQTQRICDIQIAMLANINCSSMHSKSRLLL